MSCTSSTTSNDARARKGRAPSGLRAARAQWLEEPFVYRMTNLGTGAPEVFNFIHKNGPVDVREMYATFNMGAGFAAFVRQSDVPRTIALALQTGHRAWVGGTVEKMGTRKAVEIAPLGITFDADTLAVR